MKIVVDIKEANSILQSYDGGKLQVAFYNESLKRIAIRIHLANVKEVIYVIGVGCENMTGGFSFSNVNLSICTIVDDKTSENTTLIQDLSNDFLITTSGGFSMALGLESEFGNTFENFLKNIK